MGRPSRTGGAPGEPDGARALVYAAPAAALPRTAANDNRTSLALRLRRYALLAATALLLATLGWSLLG